MVPRKADKEWIARPYDAIRVERLVWLVRQEKPLSPSVPPVQISPFLAGLFLGRGIDDPQKIIACLSPPNLSTGLYPPERLPGCEESAQKILEAIRAGKTITVYGDYDVDGMTATAILLEAVTLSGGKANYYVPNRLDEGYGLNCEALDRLKAAGTDMVVTVDCGIASKKEAEHARGIGIDLIVTDHHTPTVDPETGAQDLPNALSIVHPLRVVPGQEPYPFPSLCGAAVAFKLAWALCRAADGGARVNNEKRSFLVKAVGLAALGTVADVVSLWDENRTIVRYALSQSFQKVLSAPVREDPQQQIVPIGLRFLAETAGLNAYNHKKITTEDIGFSIAPRLNAAGREVLCANSSKDEEDLQNWKMAQALLENPGRLAVAGQMGLASLGVELLVTQSHDRARELAPFINNLNGTRQKLEQKMMSEALRQIEEKWEDAPAFVLASRSWHPGVIGIVAGRLAEKFNRPAVMIALRGNGLGTGSGRGLSDTDFSLYDAFDHCKGLLERFGGHNAAAGIGIKETNIDAFREMFCDYVLEHLSDHQKQPKLYIDGEYPLSTFTPASLADIDRMSPFGADNPRPIFVSYGVSLASPARRVGKAKTPVKGKETEPLGRTFQARFRQFYDERRAIAFGRGDWADEMNELFSGNPEITFDIAFQVVFNDYYGQVELRLLDWRVHQESFRAK